ncbi:transcription factor bHLH111 [Cocos nucifera]|nr:transcription factor bHLH111 [Cocos nucifera]
MAAQEGSEASVASSSTAPNNWWEVHTNPLPSWNTMSRWQPQNHHSNSSCDEDISNTTTSFTNTSNHSGLTMDSSSANLSGEPVENNLWSQVLLNVGSDGDLHSNHENGENFLEVLTSKSMATEIFDPACDYLKKMDSSWEFTQPSSLNSLDKQLTSYNGSIMGPERLTNLSDLVSNWSIAPPNPQLNPPSTCSVSINPSMAQYSTSNISHIKHEIPNSPSYPGSGMGGETNTGYVPCYDHDTKEESQHHQDMGASMPSFLRPFSTNNIGYQTGVGNLLMGLNNKFCSGMTDVLWSNTRNLSDLISFTDSLNKPAVDLRASKSCIKVSDSSDSKKQVFDNSATRGNGRSSATTSEGKKKRSDDSSETLFKKSKHENSTTSSLKLQAPKVKLGDKITALQQIVSPFGKTDTASVLYEAINYIRFLQEQVQLLSDPYMKSGACKDHNTWGGLERKDKSEPKLDLRSRGLCLVPISCTPQAYRDNNGPDYWTPPYRSCLYR